MVKNTKRPFVSRELINALSSSSSTTLSTRSRSSTIWPDMLGRTLAVHNGIKYIPVFITEDIVGQKLGEFSPTRKISAKHRKDKKRKKSSKKSIRRTKLRD